MEEPKPRIKDIEISVEGRACQQYAQAAYYAGTQQRLGFCTMSEKEEARQRQSVEEMKKA